MVMCHLLGFLHTCVEGTSPCQLITKYVHMYIHTYVRVWVRQPYFTTGSVPFVFTMDVHTIFTLQLWCLCILVTLFYTVFTHSSFTLFYTVFTLSPWCFEQLFSSSVLVIFHVCRVFVEGAGGHSPLKVALPPCV